MEFQRKYSICPRCNAELDDNGCFCTRTVPTNAPKPERIINTEQREHEEGGLDCHHRAFYPLAEYALQLFHA